MMKPIGDKFAFVLPTYIFVFGIWTAASSYDYISGKWWPVGSMRRRGVRHLCALTLPMLYMIFYIQLQVDADDAKEISAGILVLLFAVVEFCRTVAGLWQLHVFRQWVVSSIRSLESLGYAAEEKGKDTRGGDNGDDSTLSQRGKAVASRATCSVSRTSFSSMI